MGLTAIVLEKKNIDYYLLKVVILYHYLLNKLK